MATKKNKKLFNALVRSKILSEYDDDDSFTIIFVARDLNKAGVSIKRFVESCKPEYPTVTHENDEVVSIFWDKYVIENAIDELQKKLKRDLSKEVSMDTIDEYYNNYLYTFQFHMIDHDDYIRKLLEELKKIRKLTFQIPAKRRSKLLKFALSFFKHKIGHWLI